MDLSCKRSPRSVRDALLQLENGELMMRKCPECNQETVVVQRALMKQPCCLLVQIQHAAAMSSCVVDNNIDIPAADHQSTVRYRLCAVVHERRADKASSNASLYRTVCHDADVPLHCSASHAAALTDKHLREIHTLYVPVLAFYRRLQAAPNAAAAAASNSSSNSSSSSSNSSNSSSSNSNSSSRQQQHSSSNSRHAVAMQQDSLL